MTKTTRNSSLSPIRASEIGEYSFCPRAWWLERIAGYQPECPEVLRAGQRSHLQHGKQTRLVLIIQRIALGCIALGLLALLGTGLYVLVNGMG